MANPDPRNKKRSTPNRFREAVEDLKKLGAEDRIQLLVEAGLMQQAEADRAKIRHRNGHQSH